MQAVFAFGAAAVGIAGAGDSDEAGVVVDKAVAVAGGGVGVVAA